MYRLIPIITLLSVLLLTSCDDRPSCIQEEIDQFIKDNANQAYTSISKGSFEGKDLYIFDHGIAFDAVASVLDDQCGTVCVFGGLRMNATNLCDSKLQEAISKAERIWPE